MAAETELPATFAPARPDRAWARLVGAVGMAFVVLTVSGLAVAGWPMMAMAQAFPPETSRTLEDCNSALALRH